MIEWINRVVLGGIRELMQAARANYGVDPVAFLVIYLATVPFFYYSIFRMVRALARKLRHEVMIWSMIFLASNVAPFLYVLFFGRNLPWWVYGVIALLIGQGVYSLVRMMTKRQAPTRGLASVLQEFQDVTNGTKARGGLDGVTSIRGNLVQQTGVPVGVFRRRGNVAETASGETPAVVDGSPAGRLALPLFRQSIP